MADHSDRTEFLRTEEPFQPLSRYNKTRLYLNKDNVPVQESWDPPVIPVLETDHYYEVVPETEHRPDLISLLFYGTEQLYWVIAYANGMVDPFAETRTRMRLRIPNSDYLFQNVLAK